jgi:hypothetical protein
VSIFSSKLPKNINVPLVTKISFIKLLNFLKNKLKKSKKIIIKNKNSFFIYLFKKLSSGQTRMLVQYAAHAQTSQVN